MNKLLGPLLIVVGLLVLEIIPLRLPVFGSADSNLMQRLSNGSVIGAVFLGFIFALSFCPVSAALFFGCVVPLALKFKSGVWLPLWYGIGTALPVIGFAILSAFSARFAANFIKSLTWIERYLRRLTAFGLIAGLLGVGGGFLFVPMMMAMGCKTKEAAATSAFVVIFSSFSGFAGHLGQGHYEWPLMIAATIAVIIGSQIGAKVMTEKMKAKWIKQMFAVVLLCVAAKLLWKIF